MFSCIHFVIFGHNMFIISLKTHHTMILLLFVHNGVNVVIASFVQVVDPKNPLSEIYLTRVMGESGNWIILILVQRVAKMALLLGVQVINTINTLTLV